MAATSPSLSWWPLRSDWTGPARAVTYVFAPEGWRGFLTKPSVNFLPPEMPETFDGGLGKILELWDKDARKGQAGTAAQKAGMLTTSDATEAFHTVERSGGGRYRIVTWATRPPDEEAWRLLEGVDAAGVPLCRRKPGPHVLQERTVRGLPEVVGFLARVLRPPEVPVPAADVSF